MSRICVFCGASVGANRTFARLAQDVGAALVRRGIDLVYGGGDIGLMGLLANAVLANGGHVVGVIPQALVDREVAHGGLPDLRVVGSMHERKALISDLADGFIALPGGLGTLEELFEILTWQQLGLHDKPCGLINAAGYFDRLLQFLDHAVVEEFVRPEHRASVLVAEEADTLLDRFERYHPPRREKWIDRSSA